MSYHIYVVDKKEKVLIDAGNVGIERFEEDFEYYKKARLYIWDNQEYDFDILEDLKINKLSIKDISKFMEFLNIIKEMSFIQSSWVALSYWWINEQERELTLIGEDKLSKYKGYKVIW